MRFGVALRQMWCFLPLALAIILCPAPEATAHPHVWVDYAVSARFDREGLVGFSYRWVFDDMFSSQIMEMFDADGDGFFSAEEVEEVGRGAFSYLAEYNYFIQIRINGRDFEVRHVQDFHARIEGHLVVYEFFTPCVVKAAETAKSVHLLVADMEYFVDMLFIPGDQLVEIQGGEYVDVEARFGSSEAFSFWGGAWRPEHLTLRFKKAS